MHVTNLKLNAPSVWKQKYNANTLTQC